LKSAHSTCKTKPDFWGNQQCLAVAYDKLGRHADAEAVLAKLKAAVGDAAEYQYATIYAQWGNALLSDHDCVAQPDPQCSRSFQPC
jgi:hypothetical protein